MTRAQASRGGLVGVGGPWFRDGMETTTSADGTTIAFEQVGDGPTVVIVGGAFSVAADGAPLANAMADAGYRAVTVDRRGRGSSGDKRGSTPEDEAADLAAVIEAIGEGVLPRPKHRYRLSEAAAAQHALESGETTGSLVLVP